MVEIISKSARKTKFYGQLGVELKKVIVNNQNINGVKLWEPNWLKLKRIESQFGSNCINSRLKTRLKKKVFEFKGYIEVHHERDCTYWKIEVN